jgi:hypothetical protein
MTTAARKTAPSASAGFGRRRDCSGPECRPLTGRDPLPPSPSLPPESSPATRLRAPFHRTQGHFNRRKPFSGPQCQPGPSAARSLTRPQPQAPPHSPQSRQLDPKPGPLSRPLIPKYPSIPPSDPTLQSDRPAPISRHPRQSRPSPAPPASQLRRPHPPAHPAPDPRRRATSANSPSPSAGPPRRIGQPTFAEPRPAAPHRPVRLRWGQARRPHQSGHSGRLGLAGQIGQPRQFARAARFSRSRPGPRTAWPEKSSRSWVNLLSATVIP